MQPWFGGVSEATCAKVGRVFWGGRLADDEAMAALRAAWAHAPPSRTSSAATSAAMSAQTAHLQAASGRADGGVGGGSPMQRGASVAMSSGSLI